MRIHAICLALNEELFITETLKVLYPFCSGISVLSQYDRDWYGRTVKPDQTVPRVLSFPDPQGKIHLVIRRWKDEAATRNHEMLALNPRCAMHIMPHGIPKDQIIEFHSRPDYFLIVDADEIYDVDTFGNVVDYLSKRRPRGMRMLGYNYVQTWNRRVLPTTDRFQHFGFIKPGVLFEFLRIVSWNESRLSKLLTKLHLPDISAQLYGFIDCPENVGVFHHAWLIGSQQRLGFKVERSGHRSDIMNAWLPRALSTPTVFVPTSELPRNIREGHWPEYFFEREEAPQPSPLHSSNLADTA